jgi:hypothetical protein
VRLLFWAVLVGAFVFQVSVGNVRFNNSTKNHVGMKIDGEKAEKEVSNNKRGIKTHENHSSVVTNEVNRLV